MLVARCTAELRRKKRDKDHRARAFESKRRLALFTLIEHVSAFIRCSEPRTDLEQFWYPDVEANVVGTEATEARKISTIDDDRQAPVDVAVLVSIKIGKRASVVVVARPEIRDGEQAMTGDAGHGAARTRPRDRNVEGDRPNRLVKAKPNDVGLSYPTWVATSATERPARRASRA